jgi:hypothetical protein
MGNCTTEHTLNLAKQITVNLEATEKEMFFIHVARNMQQIGSLATDMRQNCEIDTLI